MARRRRRSTRVARRLSLVLAICVVLACLLIWKPALRALPSSTKTELRTHLERTLTRLEAEQQKREQYDNYPVFVRIGDFIIGGLLVLLALRRLVGGHMFDSPSRAEIFCVVIGLLWFVIGYMV